MEAMFLDYMMKVMRSTVPKSEMSLENSATEIYRSMHDHEVAERISKAQGVGLAEQIVAYLEGQRYLNRVSPAGHVAHGALQSAVKQPDRTGGTHEGSVTQYPSNTE
jgi:Rod binding domain-containing protein